MAENKAKTTDASVEDYILSRAASSNALTANLMALLEQRVAGSVAEIGGAMGSAAAPNPSLEPTRCGALLSSNVRND